MSTFGYGFLADWKLWLHLSTFVNAWFHVKYLIHWKYSLSTLSPLKRVHFIIWKHLMRKGYMVILMYHYSHRFVQHASSDIFCKGISGITNVKHRAENLPQTGLSVFSASLEVCLIECLRFWELQKISFGQAEKLADRREKNQSVWYRWTKASESSWKSRRHGSASIFPNVFRMWAKRKSPTDSWFMTSRMEGLMKWWHRWRQQEWLRNTAADVRRWYSPLFRHHR